MVIVDKEKGDTFVHVIVLPAIGMDQLSSLWPNNMPHQRTTVIMNTDRVDGALIIPNSDELNLGTCVGWVPVCSYVSYSKQRSVVNRVAKYK